MAIFKGAGVAIVTPMKENLEVNYDKLDEMLEEQIAGGTDAIVICGTTGESATMTEEEHAATTRFAIERVNRHIDRFRNAVGNQRQRQPHANFFQVSAAFSFQNILIGMPHEQRRSIQSPADRTDQNAVNSERLHQSERNAKVDDRLNDGILLHLRKMSGGVDGHDGGNPQIDKQSRENKQYRQSHIIIGRIHLFCVYQNERFEQQQCCCV